MLKAGLITFGSGLAAVIAGEFFGFGPCTATLTGIVLFYLGALTLLAGCVILTGGIVLRVVDLFRKSRPS